MPGGPIGRLGGWTARNARKVFVAWALVALGLGVFAPRVEHALSGAGWEASGSESVQVRQLVDRDFGGLSSSALMVVVHSERHSFESAAFSATLARAERVLRADGAVAGVVPPRPGVSVARDGHTAMIQAGATRDSNQMVRAADELTGELEAIGGREVTVSLTGASGMWSDFNSANKDAMLRSQLVS